MPGRYDYSSQMPNVAQFAPQAPSAADQQKRRQADLMRFLGGIAPAAGGALGLGVGALVGGPAGAAIGAGIGQGVGQMGGSALNYGADSTVGPQEDRANQAAMRRQELMSVLSGMRR